MSQITAKSPKHCGQRRFKVNNKKLLYIISTIFLFIISFAALLFFILHPNNPQFTLTQPHLSYFNLSSGLLSSSVVLTLESANPNTRVGIYYDCLTAAASYRGQVVAGPTAVPPFFQGPQASDILSVSLVATALPVAPSFEYDVERDRAMGRAVVAFTVDGGLRWKVGSWVSGRYLIDVSCVAVLPLGTTSPTAELIGSSQGAECSTNLQSK